MTTQLGGTGESSEAAERRRRAEAVSVRVMVEEPKASKSGRRSKSASTVVLDEKAMLKQLRAQFAKNDRATKDAGAELDVPRLRLGNVLNDMDAVAGDAQAEMDWRKHTLAETALAERLAAGGINSRAKHGDIWKYNTSGVLSYEMGKKVWRSPVGDASGKAAGAILRPRFIPKPGQSEWHWPEAEADASSKFPPLLGSQAGAYTDEFLAGTLQPDLYHTVRKMHAFALRSSPLPTPQPSPLPTPQPSALPTLQPSPLPTLQPSPLPTLQPRCVSSLVGRGALTLRTTRRFTNRTNARHLGEQDRLRAAPDPLKERPAVRDELPGHDPEGPRRDDAGIATLARSAGLRQQQRRPDDRAADDAPRPPVIVKM